MAVSQIIVKILYLIRDHRGTLVRKARRVQEAREGHRVPEDKKVIRAVLDLQDQEVCTARPVHKVRRVFAVMQVQRETTVQWGRKAYGEILAHKEYKVNVVQLVQRGILVMWGQQVQKVSLATWVRPVRRVCRALRENKVCRVQLARKVCREK